jgi:hypothetical protein
MLTAKACKALGVASRGRDVSDVQAAILRRAAELVGKMVEGSVLVENRHVSGFAPTHRGLEEYARAMTALRALNRVTSDAKPTDLFLEYRKRLLDAADRKHVPASQLEDLKAFFSALGDYFHSDVVRPVSEPDGDRLELEE